jgi:hypothetical protein
MNFRDPSSARDLVKATFEFTNCEYADSFAKINGGSSIQVEK